MSERSWLLRQRSSGIFLQSFLIWRWHKFLVLEADFCSLNLFVKSPCSVPYCILQLVCGFKHFFIFPCHIWVVILPIDELLFFRGVGQPPTRQCLVLQSNFFWWFKCDAFHHDHHGESQECHLGQGLPLAFQRRSGAQCTECLGIWGRRSTNSGGCSS